MCQLGREIIFRATNGGKKSFLVLGKIIRARQAMKSGTNDDDVIFGFGLGIPPGALPAFLSRQAVAKDVPGRIRFHGFCCGQIKVVISRLR